MDKEQKFKLAFIIILIIAIITLTFTVTTLIKNIKYLKLEPFKYGMERYNFYSCTCYNEFNSYVFYLNDSEKNGVYNGSGRSVQLLKKS